MKNKKRGTKSFFPKVVILFAFVIISLILTGVVRESYKKRMIQKEIDNLSEKAKQIEKENLEIQDKISYFESRDYQEKEAKDKLNLQSPGENVAIIKPSITKELHESKEKKEAVNQSKEDSTPNPVKWWYYFFKY